MAFELREVVRPREDLAAALQPVLGGDALERRDDRSFDPRHRVAPRLVPSQPLASERPPVRDPGAADERDPPSTTSSSRCVRLLSRASEYHRELLVRLDAAARRAQPPHRPCPTAPRLPSAVDDDGDDDPWRRLGRQRRRRTGRRSSPAGRCSSSMLIECVALADGLEHRRVERRAVGEHRHAVAVMERRLARGLERVEEFLVVDRRAVPEAVVDPGREEKHEDQPDEKDPAGDREPEHQESGVT